MILYTSVGFLKEKEGFLIFFGSAIIFELAFNLMLIFNFDFREGVKASDS